MLRDFPWYSPAFTLDFKSTNKAAPDLLVQSSTGSYGHHKGNVVAMHENTPPQ